MPTPSARRLIGRDAELARLTAAIREDLPIVVVGEAGIGKTALLRAAVGESQRRGLEVGGLAILSGRPTAALRRLLGAGLDGDAEFLATSIEQRVGPDVLIVDDVQWLDAASRDVLARLVGRIALAMAVRTGTPESEPALAFLDGLGAARVDLGPLDAAASARLAALEDPSLSAAEVARIATRAGGNPFFVLELASAASAAGADVVVRIRLAGLGDAARASAQLLAVLGHPAPAAALGPGAAELERSGIVVSDGDRLGFRHQLFAEHILATLSPDDLRSVQAVAAGSTSDQLEAARLFLSSGSRSRAAAAAELAETAAETTGDRVAAMQLRAAAADNATSAQLRIDAAAQLTDVHDYAAAQTMLEGIEAGDPAAAARIAATRAKITAIIGKIDEAAPLAAEAIRLATPLAEAGDQVAAQTLVDALATDAQIRGWTGNPDAGLELAMLGVATADRFGVPGGRIRTLLGYMLVTNERPAEAVRHLGAAIEQRRADGDGPGELQALNVLLLAELAATGTGEALVTSRALIDRARELHLYELWRGYQPYLVFVLDSAGRYREALDIAEELLLAPLQSRGPIYASAYAALSNTRLGRFEAARAELAALEPRRPEDPEADRLYIDTSGELELAQGRPAQALRLFEQSAAMAHKAESDTMEPRLNAMWARWELGRDPGPAIDPGAMPRAAAVGPESEGLVALHAGDPSAAVRRFDAAADAWSPFITWNADRARWAAAEAERLAGRHDAAVERLMAAERVAIERDARPQLTRIHRTLRLLGIRRTAPRRVSGPDLLTGRERELVDLVAAGLNNVEIGRRLGLGRGTVRRLLSSAMSKLGAETRSQAVALVEA
ncbi:MAG TPA: LuxR family transcriptional regulator [Candidatus Polarisedimenticolia bacterium]|nr:LuxR family transcriptional regulator [Candidatus Polarisedimenticolia bacterium]